VRASSSAAETPVEEEEEELCSCVMAWLNKVSLTGSSLGPARSLKRRHTPMNDVASLSANDFHDGTFLQKWCQRCVNIGIQHLGRPTWSVKQRVASLCTGSHADACILEAVEKAFKEEDVHGVQFEIGFTVEMVPEKIQVIAKLQQCLANDSLFPKGQACNFTALQACLLAQIMVTPWAVAHGFQGSWVVAPLLH
jgi:hypothetical protein